MTGSRQQLKFINETVTWKVREDYEKEGRGRGADDENQLKKKQHFLPVRPT